MSRELLGELGALVVGAGDEDIAAALAAPSPGVLHLAVVGARPPSLYAPWHEEGQR
ncbi:MAG: hypothetical protein ABSA91_13090 [Acidimicrobiales bacterium]